MRRIRPSTGRSPAARRAIGAVRAGRPPGRSPRCPRRRPRPVPRGRAADPPAWRTCPAHVRPVRPTPPGVGKRWVNEPDRLGQRLARGLDQPTGHCARTRHRDLLADHRTHRELEAVSRPGHTTPGIARHQRSDERLTPQRLVDGHRVGVEIEQLTAPRHRGRQIAEIGEHEVGLDVRRSGHRLSIGLASRRLQAHDRVAMRQPQSAPVGRAVERLHPRQGAQTRGIRAPRPG